MAASGNLTISVQCLWTPLVTKAVALEPRDAIVVPKRAANLNRPLVERSSRTKADGSGTTAGAVGRRPAKSLLSELDCVSLADRVVRRAKERLERRQKRLPSTIFGTNVRGAEAWQPIDHDKSSNKNARALQSNATDSCLWRTEVETLVEGGKQRVKQISSACEAIQVPSYSTAITSKGVHTCRHQKTSSHSHPHHHGNKVLVEVRNGSEGIEAPQSVNAHKLKVERERKIAEVKGQQRAEIYALNRYMAEYEEQNFRTQKV